MTGAWPWIALAGLGAFHGLNPAMGWLFAVALGLQRQRREAVLLALLPISIGHALSISVVVLLVSALRALIDLKALDLACAALLIGFGVYRLVARHRGRFGMQVSPAQLVLWSFLMATAHGAGLMLLPVLLGMPAVHVHAMGVGQNVATSLTAVGIHTLAMLSVAGAVGIAVYDGSDSHSCDAVGSIWISCGSSRCWAQARFSSSWPWARHKPFILRNERLSAFRPASGRTVLISSSDDVIMSRP